MAAEGQDFIFGIYDEESQDLPSGPLADRVIQTIKLHPGSTKTEIWNLLPVPKYLNYPALANILSALTKKNMVVIDADGRYTWIGT